MGRKQHGMNSKRKKKMKKSEMGVVYETAPLMHYQKELCGMVGEDLRRVRITPPSAGQEWNRRSAWSWTGKGTHHP